MTRLALIHALAHSMAPIDASLDQLWPEATRMHLLDASLSDDLARSGRGLDAVMHRRFADLADYAVGTGAQALLFTCSAFGPCIEAVARRHPTLPVLKPNQAMIDQAVALQQRGGGAIGLIASFGPTLTSMPAEFPDGAALRTALADGALDALNRGDLAAHDQAVVDAARRLRDHGCGVIALAQFSLARAAAAVRAALDLPVLTTPDSAVHALLEKLGQSGRNS